MAVPASGTFPLDNPDHTVEHKRVSDLADQWPRGIVAGYVRTAKDIGTSITTSPTIIYSLSYFTLLAGRQYNLSFGLRALYYGATHSFYFSISTTPPTLPWSLVLDCYQLGLGAGVYHHIYWEQPFVVYQDCYNITSLFVRC